MDHKEYRTFDTLAQTEAMSNEFKGNLFEFLVGLNLAKTYGFEDKFLTHFNGDAKAQLSHYESWLRKNNPELIGKLPLLAEASVKKILKQLPDDMENIHIIGKYSKGQWDHLFDEGDMVLARKSQKLTPMSLKLCKDKGYVNTKSGGIKSFINKYFKSFETSEFWQSSLNNQLELSYLKMVEELYEKAGLEFNGQFDDQWTKAGLPELPGQLNGELSKVVQSSYSEVMEIIYRAFVEFKKLDSELFSQSLLPLLGFGNAELLQMICYHKNSNFIDADLENFESIMKEARLGKVQPLKPNISSFAIELPRRTLQIRVKPMNKFTVPGYKINCSVKRGNQC